MTYEEAVALQEELRECVELIPLARQVRLLRKGEKPSLVVERSNVVIWKGNR